MKNTRSASTAKCTHNIIKKFVRLHVVFSLCIGNTTAIYFVFLGSFEKASRILILNDKTFPVAETAMGKSSRCSYSEK